MEPSIWELESFYRNRDIVIIGAGFTGLWSAISLREKFPQKSILVVERNAVPLGASTRNAGFACFGSLTEIIADAEKMGWPKTLDLVKMRFEGLQKIQTYFSKNEIDFQNCGGFEILKDGRCLEKMDEVNLKLKSFTGLDETFFLSPEKIAQFGLPETDFLVENPIEGALHPGKLVMKLLEKCQNLGIEFLFGTSILEIKEEENAVQLRTEKFQLHAERTVIATNAFAKDLIPTLDLVPVRGQILITESIPNLKLTGTFHFDEGYIYFRNLGNRVLLGGARNQNFDTENSRTLDTTEHIQNYLENFLKKVILPEENFKIAHRWSGIMAMGSAKSPIVEKISPRQIAAVRMSGMGVALAPKIGEMVAELVIFPVDFED